jgi:hypothetical protein
LADISGGRRKPPPKAEKLVEFHVDIVKETVAKYPGHPLILAGKSMGSRWWQGYLNCIRSNCYMLIKRITACKCFGEGHNNIVILTYASQLIWYIFVDAL